MASVAVCRRLDEAWSQRRPPPDDDIRATAVASALTPVEAPADAESAKIVWRGLWTIRPVESYLLAAVDTPAEGLWPARLALFTHPRRPHWRARGPWPASAW